LNQALNYGKKIRMKLSGIAEWGEATDPMGQSVQAAFEEHWALGWGQAAQG
jgi:hypothetical protein